MQINFRIPNGHMQIEADMFFRRAAKPKIKRMLKMYHDSQPSKEDAEEIRDWLLHQAETAEARMHQAEDKLRKAQAQQLDRAAVYACLKAANDNKDMIKRVRQDVLEGRGIIWAARSEITDADKTGQRYRVIISDMDKIFEEKK